MLNQIFLAGLGLGFALVFWWGFQRLPRDRYQVLAAAPRTRRDDGSWEGLALTFYGLLTAVAGTFSLALLVLLLGAVGAGFQSVLLFALGVFALSAPAAGWIAQLVEKRSDTLTVGGAILVALVAAPILAFGMNSGLGPAFGIRIPFMPAMAALALTWSLGEGLGRLACISFGCCYGKPVDQLGPALQRLFRKFHFRFAGDTRKSSYEGGLAGVPVAPIQAVSSIVLTAIGLLGAGLFLAGRFELSFGVAAVLSLAWRVLSEALRADDRGSGRLTAYQRMSLFGILYCFILLELAGSTAESLPLPDLMLGAGLLWRPETILLLESLAIALFLATGRSRVIVSRLSFHLKRAEPNSVEWSPQSCARP